MRLTTAHSARRAASTEQRSVQQSRIGAFVLRPQVVANRPPSSLGVSAMSTSVALRASSGPSNTAPPNQETRLHGRRLLVVRGVIFTVTGLTLGLYLLALPGLYPRLSIPCTDELALCLYFPEQPPPLSKLGLTPSSLIVIVMVVSYASILLVCGMAAVLIWRRSDDWMALFLALTLILMPANFTPVLDGLPAALLGFGQVYANASLLALYLLVGLFPS